MYSGTTLTKASGRLLGAHQKIDRLSRACLARLLEDDDAFPGIKSILRFEGQGGPDAIKRKSPGVDEPWHYYAPFDDEDTKIIGLIGVHYEQLVAALRTNDQIRAAFEAAWMAHAIVDGLTPAHHFPYEQRLTVLRGGESIESRNSIRKKLVIPGATSGELLRNNWRMWGPKGLLTSHGWFEWGAALIIAPASSKQLRVKAADVDQLRELGLAELFVRKAKEVGVLEMYETFAHYGWTPKLAWRVRHRLLPVVVQMVALAWYAAAAEAGVGGAAV
jgi:hypothetical protein